jgi:hypothetical protein
MGPIANSNTASNLKVYFGQISTENHLTPVNIEVRQMSAITMMANILRRQLSARGLNPPSEEDCEAIVSAMFDGTNKLSRIIEAVPAPSIVGDNNETPK